MTKGEQALAMAREMRSAQVERRVREAVEAMVEEGADLSFYAVAKRARVARSTLYRREELRELIAEARNHANERGMRGLRPARAPDAEVGESREPYSAPASGGGKGDEALQAEIVRLQSQCDYLAVCLAATQTAETATCFVYAVCCLDTAA